MFLPHIILASRSPQRLRLLESIVGPERVESLAPPSSEEQGFDSLTRWPDIRQRLLEIAGNKLRQIRQMREPRAGEIVLAADTTIVVASSPDGDALLPGTDGLETLGQPDAGDWRPQVRRWFRDHFAGRTHWAATAVVAAWADGTIREAVATTAITMRPDVDTFLEAYLATEESLGKAGGYAIQGAGSLFVTRIEGSLSNVIGLPLEIITPWIVPPKSVVPPSDSSP